VNCPIVSDASFSSSNKLFHADGPAAEKLRGPKPTVLVLGVAKSPTSADRRCRGVDIAVTGVSIHERGDGRKSLYFREKWAKKDRFLAVASKTYVVEKKKCYGQILTI